RTRSRVRRMFRSSSTTRMVRRTGPLSALGSGMGRTKLPHWRAAGDFATRETVKSLPAALPLLVLSAAGALCTGCASFEMGGARHAPRTTRDAARAAYNEAMRSFRNKDWEDARSLFGEVKKLFSYSRYARLAELRLADIDFEQEKYSEAVTSYREFIQG